jgi:UDP-2,3-diacylglucosamine pyrophosphatase LpxH
MPIMRINNQDHHPSNDQHGPKNKAVQDHLLLHLSGMRPRVDARESCQRGRYMTSLPYYWVTSDMHWGDGSARDESMQVVEPFLASCQKIPKGAVIVLLGDIIDEWSYKNIPLILQSHEREIKTLAKYNVIFVKGNHDPSIDVLRKMLPKHFFVCDRFIMGKTYFCHGHEFDLANSRFASIGKFINGIGVLAGKIDYALEDQLHEFVARLQGKGRHSAHVQFVKLAEQFIANFYGVDAIVCGHTHVGIRDRMAGNKCYYNTGTFAKNSWTIFQGERYLGNSK